MQVKPLDTLLAIKTIGLMEGLTQNDRRVATLLLDHYNRQTRQCDPSLNRLASALNISTRSVIRCTHRLVSAGLFRKIRHGGHLNRNKYEPIWSRFSEIDRGWREKLDRKRCKEASDLSPEQRQGCHLGSDARVNQTYRTNLSQEAYSRGHTKKQIGDATSRSTRTSTVGLSTSSTEASEAAAERRLSDALHREFSASPASYAEVLDKISPNVFRAATQAEERRSGSGLEFILRHLRLPPSPTSTSGPMSPGSFQSDTGAGISDGDAGPVTPQSQSLKCEPKDHA